jgi:hypothetical protein
MEAGPGPESELAAARAELSTDGIKFELLTLDAYNPKDDPYLNFDDED